MTTFTVPATVEADESPVYVAVKGEPVLHAGHRRAVPELGITASTIDTGERRPPSALVALLDPCETCDGTVGAPREGKVYGATPPPNAGSGLIRCPDCHGSGSKLVTLQQECGACIATNPDLCTVCHKPPGRNRNGLVSLPGLYRLTKLVTTLAEDDPSPFPPGPAYVRVNRSGRTFFLSPYTSQEVTVHGIPEPGGYVVAMFEKVDD